MASLILEEEIDENYAPSTKEIEEYAQWLGMVRRALRLWTRA